MPIPFLNQTTGQIETYAEQDLTPQALQALSARGLRQATPEDVANRERTLQYSTVAQQSLAQAERAVRGATLGQIEGFTGTDEEIRARADVSQEVSPVLSMAADFAPDVALGIATGGVSALATTGGRIAAKGAARAGLRAALGAAAKAAPRAAFLGETIAGGLVTGAQQAFSEGRQFFRDDPVADATNTLIWTGIGGVLGGAPMAFKAVREAGASKVAREAADLADEVDLEAAFKAGEDSVPHPGVPMPEAAGADTAGIPHTSDEGTLDAYARMPRDDAAVAPVPDAVAPTTESGVGMKEVAGTAALVGGGALAADGQTEGAAGAAAAGLAFLFPRGLMKGKSEAFRKMARVVSPIPAEKLDMPMMTRIAEMARKDLPDDAEYGEFMGIISDHFDNPRASYQQAGGDVDYLAKQTGTAGGATRGGRFVGSDGVERYVKFMPTAKAQNEVANAAAYEAFGVPAVKLNSAPLASKAGDYATAGGRNQMVMSEMLPQEWKALDSYNSRAGAVTPEMAREYVRGVPADIVLGNWDVSNNAANIMTDGRGVLRIDVGEAGPNSTKFDMKNEWNSLEKGFKDAPGWTNNLPEDMPRQAGIDAIGAVKADLVAGVSKIESAVSDAGGSAGFVQKTWPHLNANKQRSLAKQIDTRIAFLKENLDKIAMVTLIGAGAASGEDSGAAVAGVGLLGLLLGRRGLMGGAEGAGRRGAKKSMAGSAVGAELIGDSASNIAQKEAAQVARQAERGVAKAERNAVQSQAEDIVDRVTKGESPLKEGGGFMRDSRLAQYQPEILETATKEMRNDLNELNKLSQGIRERAVKQEDVAKNIADNLPAQRAKAREIALAGQRLAGSIMADARALGVQMGKKRPQHFSGTSRELVSSLINRTREIAKMTDGAEIFNALDDMKRIVDNHKVALESGSRRSAKDPMAYQNLIPRVEEFANNLRSSLEDVPTFGRAGEMQKAYNATYHQKWFPAKRVFEESVFKVTGRDYRAFDTLDAWEGKITSLLKDAGTGERRHVGDMLGALKEMAEQRAKYGTASAKETGRIVELVEKIGRTFDLADETTAAARRMQNLTNAAGVGAAAAGAVFGGIPGAVLSGGIARGATELATGKYRRAFMSMRGATDDAVNRSVDDWINVSKVRGAANDNSRSVLKRTLPKMSDEDRALLKSAKRLGATFGVAQFLGDNDDLQSAFDQKRKALQDDAGFMNRFSEEFGDLAQEEPSVYMVAAGKAAEVRKFLVDRLPASIAVSMARPSGYPPTNEAVEDWSVYWNAATNPRSVIASMARGDIRPQEVETLKTLYRPLYESLQAKLIDSISRATELGDDLDDQFVMRMSMLFDLDGAGTPAFSNRAAAVARSVQPQQPPQGTKPFAPKAASRVSPSNVAVTGPTYGNLG